MAHQPPQNRITLSINNHLAAVIKSTLRLPTDHTNMNRACSAGPPWLNPAATLLHSKRSTFLFSGTCSKLQAPPWNATTTTVPRMSGFSLPFCPTHTILRLPTSTCPASQMPSHWIPRLPLTSCFEVIKVFHLSMRRHSMRPCSQPCFSLTGISAPTCRKDIFNTSLVAWP